MSLCRVEPVERKLHRDIAEMNVFGEVTFARVEVVEACAGAASAPSRRAHRPTSDLDRRNGRTRARPWTIKADGWRSRGTRSTVHRKRCDGEDVMIVSRERLGEARCCAGTRLRSQCACADDDDGTPGTSCSRHRASTTRTASDSPKRSSRDVAVEFSFNCSTPTKGHRYFSSGRSSSRAG